MVKYRCVKADNKTNVMFDLDKTRTYVEEGIQNARKRAMKMIHGDKNVCVRIYLDSDFRERPWIGYIEKVECMSKKDNAYITFSRKFIGKINPDGSVNITKRRK